MIFDSIGNLYVDGGEIHRISPTGVDLWSSAGGYGNEGIAFDGNGNLYASMYSPVNIRKYSPSGSDLGPFVPNETLVSIKLYQPYGLAFDSIGNLYVANYDGGNIWKFSPTGADLGALVSGLAHPRDLRIVPGPVTKDQCENGGWETFAFPRHFRNQGDCLQFVNTGK